MNNKKLIFIDKVVGLILLPLSLTFDVLRIFYSLISKEYACVVNLEAESYFAKFLTAVANSKKYSGISNTHKGLFDSWLYDSYLVNPALLSKAEVLSLLLDYREIVNDSIATLIKLHQIQFIESGVLTNYSINQIAIAPTCSSTDVLRRVSIGNWSQLISSLPPASKIIAIFPNQSDVQYLAFKKLEVEFSNLKVLFTSYSAFIEQIQKSDLVICIDSQALHVAQEANKPTITLYGPTSPFGVNLSRTTFPISKSLACSPCTHKYFKLPCNNKASCMHFTAADLKIPTALSRF